jgi:tRNA(Ile)-lysidine synthase TilS/MesJ
MTKRAIAYTSDIILGNTGEIIEREFQRKRIEAYAEENEIEIVAWFEDATYTENLFTRPKVKEMLTYTEPYELVLVERTWAISRKWKEVRTLLRILEIKNVQMEAATTLWDCVSQMTRNYYRPARRKVELPVCVVDAQRTEAPAAINLVETYGRSKHKNRDRYANIVVQHNRPKNAVRRPQHLVFQKTS